LKDIKQFIFVKNVIMKKSKKRRGQTMNEFDKQRALFKQSVDALRDGTRACNNLCNMLFRDIEKLIDNAESEARGTDEFNRGYEDYRRGVSVNDEPHDIAEDQWRMGWAWAAFEPMREALKTLRKTLRVGYGCTLRQTAKAAGVSPTQLSKWTAEPITSKPDIVCGGDKE
jgi:hypothetical protein